MFSHAVPRTHATIREIMGVTAEGGDFSLINPKYFYPSDRTRLRSGVKRVFRTRHLSLQQNLDELFHYLLDQYGAINKPAIMR